MSFTAPRFTDEGKALQAKAQAGTALKFTKMQLGDGELGSQAIAAMTGLVNPLITVGISGVKAGNNYATVKSNFSNSGLITGFYWREIGVFAADPEKPNDRNSDILYCYANAGSLAEYIPAAGSEIVEKVISIPCIIGDAENVSAEVESGIYATKAELKEHIDNKNNPHGVTARQIGALTNDSLTKETILNKINVLDIVHGGTGAGTASEALENLGGLPKTDYTAADILAKLKTVDGSGSGLDADLFKGKSTIPVANGGTGASTADMALRYLGGDYIFIRRTTANDSGITESDANTMTKTGVVLTPTSGTKNFPDFFSKNNGADNGRKTLICFNVGSPTGYNGYIAFDHYSEEFAMRMGTNKAWRRVLTDKNKPMGTYSGNGNLTRRAINASGFGNVIVVYSQLGIAIVTPNGAIVTENGGTSTYLSSTEAMYLNGVMTLATTNKTLNASGYTYSYECK